MRQRKPTDATSAATAARASSPVKKKQRPADDMFIPSALTQSIAELIVQQDEKAKLEAKLAECEQKIAALKEAALQIMAQETIQSIKFRGATWYPFPAFYCSVKKEFKENGTAFAALEAAGLGDIIKKDVNAKTLTARIREMREQYNDLQGALPPEERSEWQLPPVLQPVLSVYVKPDLRSKKG